nr:hypothetical protein [Tanacetum cinerariifolium]
ASCQSLIRRADSALQRRGIQSSHTDVWRCGPPGEPDDTGDRVGRHRVVFCPPPASASGPQSAHASRRSAAQADVRLVGGYIGMHLRG